MLSNKATTFFNILSFMMFTAVVVLQVMESDIYGVLITDIFK